MEKVLFLYQSAFFATNSLSLFLDQNLHKASIIDEDILFLHLSTLPNGLDHKCMLPKYFPCSWLLLIYMSRGW